jgi:hypothetical protein
MRTGRIQDYRHNIERRRFAERRVTDGKYGLTDVQWELDGISLASLDEELADQEFELKRDFGFDERQIADIEAGRLMFYSIPECNLNRFKEQFTKLARKAEKLGSEPITMKVGEYREVTKKDEITGLPKYVTRYYDVEVRGVAPKYDGWTLGGTLQRLDLEDGAEEGMLRCVPGVEVPRELAKRLGECDHCKSKRQRKDTYAVRHDEHGWKLVGSNCIKDFLGHNSPHSLAQVAQWMIEIGQLCADAEDEGYYGGGMSKSTRFDTAMILNFAASAIRVTGFCSRKRAREDERLYATADLVAEILFADPKKREDDRKLLQKYAAIEADGELAEAAREWARGHAESTNDYLYNCSLIARSASIETRNFGLAAALVASYQRETVKRNEEATRAPSVHFGEVGKRARFTLTFLGSTEIEGLYGLKTICRFREGDGNAAVWFAAGRPAIELVEGESYDVDARVEKHGEYNGKPQTQLSRVSLHVEKPKKSKSKKAAVEAAAA